MPIIYQQKMSSFPHNGRLLGEWYMWIVDSSKHKNDKVQMWAYLMQKESSKNIHPFSCNNFQNEKWVWSGMLDKIFENILNHSLLDAKGIMEKYSSVFLQ